MVDVLERWQGIVIPPEMSTANPTAPKVLAEEVLTGQGTFRRVRQFLSGWHSELGIMTNGWQGRETVVEKDSIRPLFVFRVKE